MRATNLRIMLSLLAVAVLLVVPLAGATAQGQTPATAQATAQAADAQAALVGIHWGQSPYYPTCLEVPCRVVLVADKTGDAAFESQVKRWVDWMNYVRANSNLTFPAFGYIGP